MASSFLECTEVSLECSVEGTILSYRPNLGANAFFLAVFALGAIVQVIFGIKWRTWSFAIALVSGCIIEFVGYIGRVMLWQNPYSTQGFTIQIACLIIAPTLITAGIYLTLKHFVIAFGREYSLIKPQFYTWIFIPADVFSLVLQGVGGGLTAGGSTPSLLQTGTTIALAGIGFQVGCLVIFGILSTAYFARVWGNRHKVSPEALEMARSTKFRLFASGVVLAYFAILTRCCYRLPELAGGFRNAVFTNEIDFVVLDGVMITIATLALTVLHPGYCFPLLSAPFLARGKAGRTAKTEETSDVSDGSDVEEAMMRPEDRV